MLRNRASAKAGKRSYRSADTLSRRDWLRLAAFGITGYSASGWLEALAETVAATGKSVGSVKPRSCILLWMTGGPSQTDTFDLKPGHANGGPFQAIETAVPGIRISEHLPRLAKQMGQISILRSMSTKEGDHSRATYYLHTGYEPQGPVQFPTLGSALSKELTSDDVELPSFVSIAPPRFFSPTAFESGFLGPRYSPLVVGAVGFGAAAGADYEKSLEVKNLHLPAGIEREHADARLSLLDGLEDEFQRAHPSVPSSSHRAAYQKAVRMMRSPAANAFRLSDEPDALRDSYGRNQFGQGCLLARRLIEQGVSFVEVSLNRSITGGGNWDTHTNNFEAVKQLSATLDPAWGTLLEDLQTRGLLDSTLVVWMGEFGRTPRINFSNGRDHYPAAWSTVLCGGGIKTGQVVGKTGADGMQVEERAISVPDFLATVCRGLGIDPMRENMSNVGRPIRIVDPKAKHVEELFA